MAKKKQKQQVIEGNLKIYKDLFLAVNRARLPINASLNHPIFRRDKIQKVSEPNLKSSRKKIRVISVKTLFKI